MGNLWTSNTVAAAVSAFAVILTTVIVQRVTSRNARRAYELQEQSEDRKHTQEQINSWRTDVAELRKERTEMRAEIAEMRISIDRLEDEIEGLRSGRRDDQQYIHELVTWCKVVVVLLRQSGIPYPPVPAGVTDTNPRSLRAQSGGSTAAGIA